MMTFAVTFGQRYRREPHPRWHRAHPDGWVEVSARDLPQARALAVEHFGIAWAMMYEKDAFIAAGSPQYYPLGCLGYLSTGGLKEPSTTEGENDGTDG